MTSAKMLWLGYHGRYARSGNPCFQWISEVNWQPFTEGITDPAVALRLKGKSTARYFSFFINKGVPRLTLYDCAAGDLDFGIVQDNFVQYAKTNTVYPADDSSYVSPALLVTGRIAAKMRPGADASLTLSNTRVLQVTFVSDTHDHFQFAGDGTLAHPNLYNREVLAILPYQVNSTRFVVPYYVMTRDVRQDLAPESYTIGLQGIKGISTAITAYDPIKDASIPLTVNSRGSTTLSLTVTVTDYPCLLIFDESAMMFEPSLSRLPRRPPG